MKMDNIIVVNKEIKIKYLKRICIASEDKFSAKYQLNNELIPLSNDDNFGANERNNYRRDKCLLVEAENINDVVETKKRTFSIYNRFVANQANQVKLKSENLLKKMKRTILTAAYKVKRMNLSLEQFKESKHIFSKPYELENSRKFFEIIKEGDLKKVIAMLDKNKFYVFTFNDVKIILF